MEVRAIKNEGDPVGDIVAEPLLKDIITLLGEERPPFGEFLHLGIVINVEMLRFKDMPIEFRILDLISPEIKILRGC